MIVVSVLQRSDSKLPNLTFSSFFNLSFFQHLLTRKSRGDPICLWESLKAMSWKRCEETCRHFSPENKLWKKRGEKKPCPVVKVPKLEITCASGECGAFDGRLLTCDICISLMSVMRAQAGFVGLRKHVLGRDPSQLPQTDSARWLFKKWSALCHKRASINPILDILKLSEKLSYLKKNYWFLTLQIKQVLLEGFKGVFASITVHVGNEKGKVQIEGTESELSWLLVPSIT